MAIGFATVAFVPIGNEPVPVSPLRASIDYRRFRMNYAANVVHLRAGHRTPAQILAQMEARYAELEALAGTPAMQFPCTTCRWADKFKAAWCHHPLVKGFDGKFHMGMVDHGTQTFPRLCGIEKALWEAVPPKVSRLRRLWDWFLAPWREA